MAVAGRTLGLVNFEQVDGFMTWVWLRNKANRVRVAQVLVFGSIYHGAILVHLFEPHIPLNV